MADVPVDSTVWSKALAALAWIHDCGMTDDTADLSSAQMCDRMRLAAQDALVAYQEWKEGQESDDG